MCEHNLVIGNKYKIVDGVSNCPACDHSWPPEPIEVIYLGDFIPQYHRFKPLTYRACPSCRRPMVLIDFMCGGAGGPIDVTQEFLSLPVRSRK